MAKNRSSAFDFGEDLFSGNTEEKTAQKDKNDKLDKTNKIDEIDKMNEKDNLKPSESDKKNDKKDETNKINKTDKEDKINNPNNIVHKDNINEKDKLNEMNGIIAEKKEEEINEKDKMNEMNKTSKTNVAKSNDSLLEDEETEPSTEIVMLSTKISVEDRAWMKVQARKRGENLKDYVEMIVLKAPICDCPEEIVIKSQGKKIIFSARVSKKVYDEFYRKARESALTNVEYLWYIINLAKGCETENKSSEE